MDKELKAKWTKELRSDKYKQGTGCLYSEHNNSYCCLGILGRVMGYDPEQIKGYKMLSSFFVYKGKVNEIPIDYPMQDKYARLNDKGRTFKEIADILEKDESI